MSRIDHSPSTTRPSSAPRRAAMSALAALAALVLPVTLAAAMDPAPGASASPADPASTTSVRGAVDRVRSAAAGRAVLADLERMAQVVAPPPTSPPATPSTTEGPVAPVAAAPAPVPAPVTTGGGYADPGNPAAWDRLAACESGGHWAANTGNGYYGGIQFSLASWQGVGGVGRPDQASRETQIAMGQRLWDQGGWGHWPACSRQLGYR